VEKGRKILHLKGMILEFRFKEADELMASGMLGPRESRAACIMAWRMKMATQNYQEARKIAEHFKLEAEGPGASAKE